MTGCLCDVVGDYSLEGSVSVVFEFALDQQRAAVSVGRYVRESDAFCRVVGVVGCRRRAAQRCRAVVFLVVRWVLWLPRPVLWSEGPEGRAQQVRTRARAALGVGRGGRARPRRWFWMDVRGLWCCGRWCSARFSDSVSICLQG